MKTKTLKIKIAAALAICIFLTTNIAAQTTAFNYQGKLNDAGVPASGSYQLQFKLFDAGGGQIGATVADVPVTATNGVFSVKLDFGAAVFTGANRFLEISVRHNASESYVTLSPREQIASTPYSIRTLSAAQADLSLDSNKLGGIAASQYVTTTSVGNSFIKNGTVAQTGNFNISGNGTLGGTLQANQIRAQTGTGFYGLTQTDGTTTLSTYIGGSTSGASGGWLGTPSNSPLYFFTNNSQPQTTLLPNGNFGIGTTSPAVKLDVNGDTVIRTSGTGGNMQLGTPSGETGITFGNINRADIRFDDTTLRLFAGTGRGIPAT